MEFINKGSYEFIDISSEEWREYHFPCGKAYRVEGALKLAISKSGHRIFDNRGTSHFIPYGWLGLNWKAKPGEPNFVK